MIAERLLERARAVAVQDDLALNTALDILKSDRGPSILLLSFAGADEPGHGYGGASTTYAQVVQGIDKRLATLVAKYLD